jgi:hypothetical protein
MLPKKLLNLMVLYYNNKKTIIILSNHLMPNFGWKLKFFTCYWMHITFGF